MGGTSESEREKERKGMGRDTVTQGPGAFGRGGEGTKQGSMKPKNEREGGLYG